MSLSASVLVYIMKKSTNEIKLALKQIQEQIQTIPKKNKRKFAIDLINLINKAHKDDYENFEF